jgi:ABC-2 type transport system ATP-binding protein
MTAAVRVRALDVVRGGRAAVDGVSFEVPAGQVTGLLGPSGSGKTSLIRAVVGVQVVAGGTVEVLGRPAGSRELRHRIGYVTQAPSVYDDLTVEENIRFFGRVLGLDRDAMAGVVDAVALGEHTHRRVSSLSGGERSRVSLAVALLGTPDLLLLDEPTVGLDPVLRRDLWAIFHRLAAAGAAVLVSSHVMDEAVRCDRLLLMRDGRLVADETPDELLSRTGCADVESAFLKLVDVGPGS